MRASLFDELVRHLDVFSPSSLPEAEIDLFYRLVDHRTQDFFVVIQVNPLLVVNQRDYCELQMFDRDDFQQDWGPDHYRFEHFADEYGCTIDDECEIPL